MNPRFAGDGTTGRQHTGEPRCRIEHSGLRIGKVWFPATYVRIPKGASPTRQNLGSTLPQRCEIGREVAHMAVVTGEGERHEG